jgi:hypothetical protein
VVLFSCSAYARIWGERAAPGVAGSGERASGTAVLARFVGFLGGSFGWEADLGFLVGADTERRGFVRQMWPRESAFR